MTSSKLIRSEALSNEAVAWTAPEVDGRPATLSAAALEEMDSAAIRQQAWDTGFKEGRTAGLESGRQELMLKAASLEQVLAALARPLHELDHRVEEELLALVHAIVRQVVRREVNLDSSHVVGVIREGLTALPLASEDIVVRLHPADAEVARECLPADDDDRAWRIEADPVIQRGGCLIVTSTSHVDERLETRLGRAIATMFEDERKNDD